MLRCIVIVVGPPRCGTNLMVAIIQALGYPGPKPILHDTDIRETMPVGSYADFSFQLGNFERKPPWVFKAHGFKRSVAKAVGKLPNIRAIEMVRDAKVCIRSIQRKLELERGVTSYETAEHDYNRFMHRVKMFDSVFKGERIRVRFDDLIQEPRSEISRVANFLQVPVTENAVAIVDPNLDHTKEFRDER